QDSLAADSLLAPPEMRLLGIRLWWIGSAMILGLGGDLLAVGLAKGEPIVAFIVGPMAFIGMIALAPACLAFRGTSPGARAHLGHLDQPYARLRSRGGRGGRPGSAPARAGDPDAGKSIRESSALSDRLLMDGIFGEVSPADTPFHDLWNAMVL